TALYVGLSLSEQVARIDLSTFTESTRFGIGTYQGEPLDLRDVQAVPGTNDRVAVAGARGEYGHFVALFTNGVRTDLEPDGDADVIAFASPSELYGVILGLGSFSYAAFDVVGTTVSLAAT